MTGRGRSRENSHLTTQTFSMRKEVRGGSVCLGWTLRIVERLTFKGSDQGCVKELPCPPLRTLARLENRHV